MRVLPSNMKLILAAAVVALPGMVAAQTFTVTKVNIGGEGGHDYITADAATGRVYVSRGTHFMIVDGATGKVLGDIPDAPRNHGAVIVTKEGHGFTTNGGDSTSTMFDSKDFHVIKKVHAGINGLDGIMYDDATNKVLTINHSKPGSMVIIDAKSGDVVGKVELTGDAPEGGVSDGKGKIFVNLEDKHAIDVVDTKTWKVVDTWALAPCAKGGPTGIAMDRTTNRIFSGCDDTSVVVNAATGKVVAKFANGGGVDALGWDQGQKLIYIPAGEDGNVTVVHEDGPDKYTTVATVSTQKGAKTITVDDVKHVAYALALEYGPAPAGAAPPAGGRGRGRPVRGPVIGAWLITIKH